MFRPAGSRDDARGSRPGRGLISRPFAWRDSHVLDPASEPERALLFVDLPAHRATAVEPNIEPLVKPDHKRRRQDVPTGGLPAVQEEAPTALALAGSLVVQYRLVVARGQRYRR